MPPLEGLAYWPEGQQRLIDALLALAERREFLYVVVVEKGRKARKVQVPIALFRETLRRWVWDHRARFIDSVKRRDRAWLPPDALWLSRKTRRGLVAHSIGNEMKKAFARLGPPSDALSGHRLRAFYLTQLIRRLYRKALALQGRLLDVDAILNEAAELAGHSDPKSLKPYLDQEIMAGLALDGHAVMVVQKEDAEILRGIAGALDDGVHGLHARLRELANEFELKPIPDVETARDAVAALVRHQERVSHRADRG
jgi:hypothetical protein